jgi:hypothetical protein
MHPDVGPTAGPTAGERAPDAEVFGVGGTLVRLAGLWAEQPVALVFLRHYG